ncbi:porin family protein [Frigoriflavimonas asaccharolytica]|uniref:Outer membrane protein beta-barrel domain-containing protein n=1 Tax=Frigoriflavimonas asaccharolytica TaxID=2735899 RepID=A0A8J8G9Y1_9FLAO|nr:porin family protein [Frigoriflavimonas asaccharolytica]NRS91687.1 hypothetical protein [Frigoriflavimonas asaccharolytica]
MKKFILASLVLVSTFSFAQVDLSSTRYGVTIGGNYSRVRNAHNPSGPIYGFQAGGLALIPVDKNNQFYIQPEVVFYGAGETGKDKDAKGTPGYDAIYSNSYVSVPVYFKGYFSEAESEFFAMAGPRFNFLIDQKVTDPSKPYYTEEGLDIPGTGNVNGKASSFNFALGFGLGYSYKRQLELALKYDMGLSDIYKGLRNEPGTDPNISKKKTEHVVSIGLAYIFE